ncbi:MAG: hypothetical protein HYU97_05330 [Deltaproteobacteria bacterium]|nr:hypothetical protein [Deltaproteobacteria bacterium]
MRLLIKLKNFLSRSLALLLLISVVSLAKAEEKKKHLVSGSLTNKYKFRATNGFSDNDLESILTLNVGNPRANRFSFSAQGGGIFDLDGKKTDSYFSDIYNSFPDAAVGRLYYAYLNINKLGPIDHVRVGRQRLFLLESHYFDGLSIETVPLAGFVLTVFGGTPVHLYENQIGMDWGDWMAGASLQWNPISKLRLRFDYTHLKDQTSGFRVSQGDLEDDLFGISFWANLTKNIELYGRFTSFSDEVRDAEAALNFQFPEQDLTVRLNYFRLLKGYDIRVTDWDAFGIAGSYVPYNQAGLSVTKGLGEKFSVDGGFVLRKLDNNQTASAFNHGYLRGFVSLGSQDFLAKGLEMNATFDYYHGIDNTLKNDYYGGSFGISQQLLKKRLKLGAGTAFYLYRYNLLTGNESDNVQTYFANVEAKILKNLKAKAAYEFEDNDFDNFHEMKLSLTWDF